MGRWLSAENRYRRTGASYGVRTSGASFRNEFPETFIFLPFPPSRNSTDQPPPASARCALNHFHRSIIRTSRLVSACSPSALKPREIPHRLPAVIASTFQPPPAPAHRLSFISSKRAITSSNENSRDVYSARYLNDNTNNVTITTLFNKPHQIPL